MKDLRVYLVQILECIDRIESYAARGEESFLAENLIQDAVLRNFEVIGEVAKRIPEAYRKENPGVPWRSLAGFRDVLIHHSVVADHPGIDLETVWRTVVDELPKVKTALTSLLPPLDELEKEINDE